MVYSTFAWCCFVLVFFGPLGIGLGANPNPTSLGEERANLSAFRTFIRFALVWCFLFLFLGVWEVVWHVTVALTELLLPFLR